MAQSASQRERIKVVCRIRPENKLEKEGNYQKCVTYEDLSITVNCTPESKVSDMSGQHTFSFDRVFGPLVRQVDVFQEVAKPIVDGVVNGFNGTVFCYGQTGSGKTFTMEGADYYNDELKGLLPRMFSYLFNLIEKTDPAIEFNIKCSFLEIYMEKIQDLLDPKKNNLNVKEEKGRGIYVADATEVYVSSAEEMFEVMRAGSKNRSIAATRMNEKSSRSHSIFILTVYQKNTTTDAAKMGKLFLCDLAGSEKVGKTNASGQTLEEAKMINKSLSALGNVINALTEAKSGAHIPYRDSKLTRILQESLGGNSQTCLVITCSLSAYNDRETLSTLRFGNRAKSIKNKVVQNAERSAKELLIALNDSENRIEKQGELVKIIQRKISTLLKELPQVTDALIEECKAIATATDLEFLYLKLKGLRGAALAIEESKEDEEQDDVIITDITPAKVLELAPAVEIEQAQPPIPEEAKKKFEEQIFQLKKQLLGERKKFNKATEELDELQENKRELENELQARNEEIYQVNEKIMNMELLLNNSSADLNDKKSLMEVQGKFEKVFEINSRRTQDFQRLKSHLERLKCDFNLIQQSKKQGKFNAFDPEEGATQQEASVDSDRMINDQITSTIEHIQRIIDANLQLEDGQSKMDTTMMSDMGENLNILPDMVDRMDIEESSFLQLNSSGANKLELSEGGGNTSSQSAVAAADQSVIEEQSKKIRELEAQLEEKSMLLQNTTVIKEAEEAQQPLIIEQLKGQSDAKDKLIKDLKDALHREVGKRDRQVQELQSKLREQEDTLKALMESDSDKKAVFQVEAQSKIIMEKNKTLMTEVISLRKELDVKERDMEKAQIKAAQAEKKYVLVQRQLQEQQILNKVPQAQQYVMPFQNAHGQLQFGSMADYMQPTAVEVAQPLSQSSTSLFFNRKVLKPVKGGGKGIPTSNPYNATTVAIRPSSQGLSFNDFKTMQQAQPQKANPKNKVQPFVPPAMLGNTAAPIIKPEFQKEFQSTLSQQQTPQQIQLIQQKQKEAKEKLQKELYLQKYREAKQLSQQNMNHEESFASQESEGEEEYYDEEDEEPEANPAQQQTAFSKASSEQQQQQRGRQGDPFLGAPSQPPAQNQRRGKSLHNTLFRSSSDAGAQDMAGGVEKKKKSGIKGAIKNVMKAFW